MSTPFLNDDALAAAAWGALLACLLAWGCWAAIALMAVWPGMFGKPSARPVVLVNLAALVSIAGFTSILSSPAGGPMMGMIVGATGLILTFVVAWERVVIHGEQVTLRQWGRPRIVIRFEEIASVRWCDEPANSDTPSAKTEIIKRDGGVIEFSLRGPVRWLERALRQREIPIEGSPRQARERELFAILFTLSIWLVVGGTVHCIHLFPFV